MIPQSLGEVVFNTDRQELSWAGEGGTKLGAE